MTSCRGVTLKGGLLDNRSRPSAVSPAPTTISRRFREHHGAPPPQYPPEDRGGDEDEAGDAAQPLCGGLKREVGADRHLTDRQAWRGAA